MFADVIYGYKFLHHHFGSFAFAPLDPPFQALVNGGVLDAYVCFIVCAADVALAVAPGADGGEAAGIAWS